MRKPDEAAQQIAAQFSYETVIDMKLFDAILDVALPKHGSLQEIQKAQMDRMTMIDQTANILLKEHNLMLKNVRAEGYKLVHPESQVQTAMFDSGLKIRKELLKAKRRVTHVRTDELDTNQQKDREDALAKLNTIGKMMKKKEIV